MAEPLTKMKTEPTVLIVEDDVLIRSCPVEFLQDHGIKALEADSCAAARTVARQTDRVHVAIMDLSLPDGNGIDLGHEMTDRWPDLSIIFTSGHSHLSMQNTDKSKMISKPYLLDKILETIIELTHAA